MNCLKGEGLINDKNQLMNSNNSVCLWKNQPIWKNCVNFKSMT